MNVELPDGTIIEDIPEGTTRAQLAAKLKANGMQVPAEWMRGAQPESGGVGGDTGKLGLGEAALSIGSGTLGSAVGGIAGLVGAALPGEPGQGARVAQRVQQAMTYEPRTEYGKQATNVISYLPAKLAEFADYAGGKVSESTGSPLLGTAANAGIQFAPALIGGAVRPAVTRGLANAERAASRNAVADQTLQRAQNEGFVTEPQGMVGTALTSAGGLRNVRQKASLHNAEVSDQIGRREAGLAPDEPLEAENFQAARERMAEPYREVSAMSPDAAAALDKLQVARADANAWYKFYQSSKHPTALKRAQRFQAEATRQENIIDSIAQGSKNPGLLQQLREARQSIAKNYDVERATNTGNGHMDARAIGARLKANAPLSDGLETVGRFANAHPNVTVPAARIGVPGASHSNAVEAAAGMHIFGPAGIGIPFLRGGASSLALSKMLQPGPTRPGLGIRLADIATRNPYALGVAPSLGLRPPEE